MKRTIVSQQTKELVEITTQYEKHFPTPRGEIEFETELGYLTQENIDYIGKNYDVFDKYVKGILMCKRNEFTTTNNKKTYKKICINPGVTDHFNTMALALRKKFGRCGSYDHVWTCIRTRTHIQPPDLKYISEYVNEYRSWWQKHDRQNCPICKDNK